MGKNRHNTKRKRDDLDGSDAEDEQKKGNEKKNSHVQTNIYKSPNKSWSKATFKTNFWPGPAGEENPSDELKELRKLNGILARNNLDKCPPPVTTLDDDQLPSLFRDYCCNQSISIPSAVQMQTWPAALNGANVLAIAPTGSGKTLAYCLPAAVHILSQPTSHRLSNNKASPYVLVLSPTRELAIQIHAVFKSLRNISPAIKTAILYGGIEKEQQIDTLRNLGNQFRVLVATPGRLLDILQSADSPLTLDLVSLQVIDEADRMLAMGFLEQLQVVNEYLHPARQRLMFSATFPGRLRELSDIWLPNHVMIRCNAVEMNVHERKVKSAPRDEMVVEQSVDPVESDNTDDPRMEEQTEQPNKKQKQQQQEDTNISALQAPTTSTLTLSSSITQLIHICATHKKPRLLIKFIERIRKQEQDEKLRQAAGMVIFCNSIKTLGFVVSFLLKQEVKCVPLHSQLPQNLRETNLLSFKSGKVNVMVATDVAARGIHIKRLRYVVNYDFPSNLEQYCHRIGRCGRQGEVGHAYSFMTRNMAPMAGDLIALLRSAGQEPEANLFRLQQEFLMGQADISDGAGGAEEPTEEGQRGEEEVE